MSIWPQSSRADDCPVCGTVHGETDELWTCPRHLHELQEHGRKGQMWRYTCPAHQCPYERLTTAPRPKEEPPPMTHSVTIPQSAAPGTDLMLRRDQDFWDAKQLAALRQIGVENAPNPELAVFFHYCQRTQLDPFARQISMVRRGDKWTIQIGIDGYRLIARRAADRDGGILSYSDPAWYDADGNEYPVWVRDEPPAAAKVTVIYNGARFPGVARYKAFVALHPRSGQPMGQWETMPDHMTAKCAEAQALRRAFPHDLGDTTTVDETQHDTRTWHAPAVAVEASDNGDDGDTGDESGA